MEECSNLFHPPHRPNHHLHPIVRMLTDLFIGRSLRGKERNNDFKVFVDLQIFCRRTHSTTYKDTKYVQCTMHNVQCTPGRRHRWISEGSWPSLRRHGVALGAIRGGHKMAASQLPIDFCRSLPNIPLTPPPTPMSYDPRHRCICNHHWHCSSFLF